MERRNSKEIIQDILERYNFTTVYSDSHESFGLTTSKNYCETSQAIDFLYSSAIIGSKSLGIFNELPFFEVTIPTKAECLFITNSLPKYISSPIIIIKNPEDIARRLSTATKISTEHKIPVTVVLTSNAINNYISFDKVSSDLAKISPYMNDKTFRQSFSQEELNKIYKTIYNTLTEAFPQNNQTDDTISLYSAGYFPDFFVPKFTPEVIKSWDTVGDNLKIKAYKKEKSLLETFFFNNYHISLNFSEVEDKIYPSVYNLLCAGCPFVNILARGVDKDTIIFTNMKCPALLKAFPEINYISIDGYMGIIANKIQPDTLFVGKASSYKTHYANFLSQRGRIILLNDNGVSKVDGFISIRHPKKLTKTRNTLYPYGCHNIKNYPRIKVRLNKNKPIDGETRSYIFEKSLCPAIYFSRNNISIDNNICNGCLACKELYKQKQKSQGAVS